MSHQALKQYFQLYQIDGIADFFSKDCAIDAQHISAIIHSLTAPPPVTNVAPPVTNDPLHAIRLEIDQCKRCSNIAPYMKKIVYGTGSIDAKVFIIGNPPIPDESGGRGIPFTGSAFMKTYKDSPGDIPENRFNRLLSTINLTRDQAFITNITKCRPKDDDHLQMSQCLYFLQKQLDVVKPSVIIIFGFTAANIFFDQKQDITFYRKNTTLTFQDIPVFVTFNPADFNKNEDLARYTFEDLKLFNTHFGDLL